MRRILVVDDDPHICLAVRAWLKRYGFKVAIADGGIAGLVRARQFDVRSDDRRYLHAWHARFRIDQSISQSRPRGTADRDFRIRFLQPGDFQPRLPENGAQARRDTLPAQALQANHIAQCDRRMPVGGRTSPQVCRYSGRRCERGVGIPGQDAVISQAKRGCLQLRQAFRHRRCRRCLREYAAQGSSLSVCTLQCRHGRSF